MAASVDHLTRLTELLDEKRQLTTVSNLEPAGLTRLAEVLQATKADATLIGALQDATSAITRGIRDRNVREEMTECAQSGLQQAIDLLRTLSVNR
jgi:hypothetical protein